VHYIVVNPLKVNLLVNIREIQALKINVGIK
jgi:hypothetical protein